MFSTFLIILGGITLTLIILIIVLFIMYTSNYLG